MPAPVECKAEVTIDRGIGVIGTTTPIASVRLNCVSCPVGQRSFSPEADYSARPEQEAIRNAQVFLARGCGLKKGGEAVILPEGL